MPSRPVTAAIALFWLLATGWFVAREVLPKWRTGEPPPYAIELVDEAQRITVPHRWVCTFNGQKIGTIRTGLSPVTADDTYELVASSTRLELPVLERVSVALDDYEDRVRVTRDGELRAIHTAGRITLDGLPKQLTGFDKISGSFDISAEVIRGRLHRHILLRAAGWPYEPSLDPTDPPAGTILNPMHPVPRITGLRPGQTWRQPLIDPRMDIIRAALKQAHVDQIITLPKSPDALTASVLPESQILETENQARRCLVIEYRDGEDYLARTWVLESDGTVVRQEAGSHGDVMVLQKE